MTYDHEQISSITFGGIPSFLKADENREAFENSVSHRVAGDDHWMLKMNDIRVGDKTIEPTINFAMTDTGTSLIYLDTIEYKNLIKFICEDQYCFSLNSLGMTITSGLSQIAQQLICLTYGSNSIIIFISWHHKPT